MTATTSMVSKAHELLARGFQVFPADHPDQPKCVGAHQSAPCDGQRGKHPCVAYSKWNVVTDAMIDTNWRRRGGRANVAVNCGPSGLVVLDDDGDLDKWAATYGLDLPETYTVTTGRGRHLYYRWDHSAEKIGNVDFTEFKIDIRGAGGYAIGEGSQHFSGAIYTGNGHEIVDLPPEVADLLLARMHHTATPPPGGIGEPGEAFTGTTGEDPNKAMIGWHKRHKGLIAYACRLRSRGLDYTEAEKLFRERWLLCVQPTGQIPEAKYHGTPPPECNYPVTWEEAGGKLRDVYARYDAGRPEADIGGSSNIGDGDTIPKLAAMLLNRTALMNLPDPAPLIDNVLDQGTVALLYGKWGTGKSFIAYDWAASVSTGRAWQGRASEKRRVLYVAAEGAFGIKARTRAWEVGWHTQTSDEELLILPRAVNLTHYGEIRELAALIDWGGYGLVLIDTLARCMVGADENSAKDCGIVVDALTQLRERTPDGRGTVVGVHHTGKDGKTFRGSSVFEAGAETVYSVNRDGAVILLDREKRKDGPQIDSHRLKLEQIDGTDSCVIGVENLSTWGVDKSDRAARLLSTFVHHFVHTGATKAELRLVAEMPPATFHRALSDLIKSGDLVNEGTDRRPFYKGVAQ